MAITQVFDTQNVLERYIKEDTPEEYRVALLSGVNNAQHTQSAELVITDELGKRVSILIDNLQERPVLIIGGEGEVMVTAHDLVRIRKFFTEVVEALT